MHVMGTNPKTIAVGKNVDSIKNNDSLEVNDSLQKYLLDFLNVDDFAARHRRCILNHVFVCYKRWHQNFNEIAAELNCLDFTIKRGSAWRHEYVANILMAA